MQSSSEAEGLCSEINELTEKFFLPESPLEEASRYGGRPYEYRPQQAEMAREVARSLSEGTNLCVEAPTGIGKSFAYLVPAIYYSLEQHKPVVISTETISLQEQLIEKDIPILHEITGLDFSAALAKGRSNYLCMRRLGLARGESGEAFLPEASMLTDIEKIARWAEYTFDGSLSTLDFSVDSKVWHCVCCEGTNCSGPKCSFFKSCFYWRARREWDKANIIVANHALFFTDLKIKQEESLENTLLPPYSAAIIDEAHTIEDNAANHLGLHINNAGLFFFLNRLYNPRSGRGLLLKAGEHALELRQLVSEIHELSSRFFEMAEENLIKKSENILRLRRPNFVPDILSEPLAKLREMLYKYYKELDDKDMKMELEGQFERCDSFSKGIFDFVNMEYPEHVYWLESRQSNRTMNLSLMTAPLNVSEILDKILFSRDFPVILTSATLTVRKSLDYYKSRTGYSGGELVLDTPFDYKSQVKLFIPREMPEPTHDSFTDTAAEQIRKYTAMTHGKAFVLFTSYGMLNKCAEKLLSFFSINNIRLLIQSGEANRTAMLDEFRKDTDSVIFGTTSFWTGVDVPGEALSNVIVTKLPFSVPSHPLIEARCERLSDEGSNPFMQYSLPEAVLKFRQGIGRLIRSKSDTGIIVVLDRRVITKRYGSFFLDSIPPCTVDAS